ncbi:bifunctional methylenetetrahydrofolate dehydrogenase/methenyltetrahydrofolate cyclohydrolase [soil metagenome]
MDTIIIDGKAIAAEILAEVKAGVPSDVRPIVRAVVVAPTPVTESYLRVKAARAGDAGMELSVVSLPSDATTEEVIAAVQAPGAAAVIVQLPLPAHVDSERILLSIPVEKDADVLSPKSYALFTFEIPEALVPPVAAAVCEVLKRSDIELTGAQAVVVGKGRLVGAPVAAWLHTQGTQVMSLSKDSFADGAAALRAANIIVSGAGIPHLITPDMISGDTVLIDAGTSEQEGAIKGDIDPACVELASVFTPVPGGIGPIAVACLFRNVALLHNRENGVN